MYVYIAKCRDGSYYTGVAANVEKRLDQHNSGRGAKYTRGRRPITLVHLERCRSLSTALKRERQIKRWKRTQKEALILKSKAR
ncbi:MAG: GIY-YIG nuclease family protein [Candidatus Zixiibacteriota bacterium]